MFFSCALKIFSLNVQNQLQNLSTPCWLIGLGLMTLYLSRRLEGFEFQGEVSTSPVFNWVFIMLK